MNTIGAVGLLMRARDAWRKVQPRLAVIMRAAHVVQARREGAAVDLSLVTPPTSGAAQVFGYFEHQIATNPELEQRVIVAMAGMTRATDTLQAAEKAIAGASLEPGLFEELKRAALFITRFHEVAAQDPVWVRIFGPAKPNSRPGPVKPAEPVAHGDAHPRARRLARELTPALATLQEALAMLDAGRSDNLAYPRTPLGRYVGANAARLRPLRGFFDDGMRDIARLKAEVEHVTDPERLTRLADQAEAFQAGLKRNGLVRELLLAGGQSELDLTRPGRKARR